MRGKEVLSSAGLTFDERGQVIFEERVTKKHDVRKHSFSAIILRFNSIRSNFPACEDRIGSELIRLRLKSLILKLTYVLVRRPLYPLHSKQSYYPNLIIHSIRLQLSASPLPLELEQVVPKYR